MDADVEAVAARLRRAYGATPHDDRAAHDKGTGSRNNVRAFARLPSRSRPRRDDDRIDWTALLHTVFRRFAGDLVVYGKLLNREDLEVYRFARLEATPPVVVSLIGAEIPKFVVRMRDAPTEAVGSVVTAAVVAPHARICQRASLPVAVYQSDLVASRWESTQSQCITDMKSVVGFEVASFVAPPTRARRRDDHDDDDSEDDCANGLIRKHETFSDLRGVRRLMEASHLTPRQWPSLLTRRSEDTEHGWGEDSAWSFVSLGMAQKKRWAHDRLVRGDALRAKGRLKECLVEYDSALRLDETFGDALLRRGQVYIDMRQYDDAIRDLEQLCKLEPTNEKALEGLLRAKGKRSHSKHVTTVSFHGRSSRSVSREMKQTAEPVEAKGGDPKTDEQLAVLERDRLRKLLEDEAKARKHARKKSSRHRSDSDSSSSRDSDASSIQRKHKESKKTKRSSSSRDRKRRSKKSSRRRRDDDSVGSSSERSDSPASSRRRKRSRRSRSRSRERSSRSSRSGSVSASDPQLHPILARKSHRLWN